MPYRTTSLLCSVALLLAISLLLSGCGSGGPSPGPIDVGVPLIITDLLKANQSAVARSKSKVDLSAFKWSNDIHSGFFELDPKGTAEHRQTFFVYSAAQNGNAKAPLLLWLQGGPGASSLFGMFTEIGPFGINKDAIEPRKVNWNQDYHLLFLDNPVGTGFSYTDTDQGYVSTHEQAGEDLRNAISQFFEVFPDLRANDFYVTGESYAGKWVPAAAFTIHTFNQGCAPDKKINLKGISIGDGAMDPKEQFQGFGNLLWYLGMVDEAEKEKFESYEKAIQDSLKLGDNITAFERFDEMLNGDFYKYGTYYNNVTGMSSNYFNFELSPDATPLGGDFVKWLNKPELRAAFHVGPRSYAPDNSTVEAHLLNAWLQGVVDMLVPLMENYKVLVYSGQNDIILGAPLTEQFLTKLEWKGQDNYNHAQKIVWRRKENGPGSKMPDVAGYVKQSGKFTYAVVRGAGHMVPGDQPERALDLLHHFISDVPFTQATEEHRQGGEIVV